jgi:phage tail sheath protein FI
MASLLSPQVYVKETDLTTIVPAVSSTEGAIAGQYQWGPVNEPVLINSENELVKVFGKPNNTNANDWWTSANFLAYSNKLHVVRVVNDTADTTSDRARNATATGTGFLLRNRKEYENNYENGGLQDCQSTGPWIAKYAGELGNSIGVSVAASGSAYQSTLTGTIAITANSRTVTGTGTAFNTQAAVGDFVIVNNEVHEIQTINSATSITLKTVHRRGAAEGSTAIRRWRFYSFVDSSPNTSNSVARIGGSDDELHVIVYDSKGYWSGVKGTVLEIYQLVSQSVDSKLDDGSNNFYKEVINKSSEYVYWAGHDATLTDAGSRGDVDFEAPVMPLVYELTGGSDGVAVDEEQKIPGYSKFRSKEDIDVSFILGSDAGQTLAVYIINNITEVRKDCVAFFSPPRDIVVNNEGNEATDIVVYRNTLPSTSYATLDGNWKKQYDVYNDVYRYVPLNGDVAGLYAKTDNERDAWWAAAGFNRGHVKNVINLAWNPHLADRDVLYKNAINPVVSFSGEGPVLYGNKTLLNKPSAFDRMNVRRLFIVLEKAISRASQYSLFEFNDEFTRAQFRNLVDPFLRDVKGRRGVYDFQVVCDESNNTPVVIDRNEFRGDIYIKPARTAEFITLNFIATPTGVAFTEVVGRAG